MSVREVLERQQWAIGYCRAGAPSRSYVLFWPLGATGLWEVDFAPFYGFLGLTDEDTFVFSRDDDKAVQALEECDIDWPVSIESAQRAAEQNFPRSTVVAGNQTVGAPFLLPRAGTAEHPKSKLDPWK